MYIPFKAHKESIGEDSLNKNGAKNDTKSLLGGRPSPKLEGGLKLPKAAPLLVIPIRRATFQTNAFKPDA